VQLFVHILCENVCVNSNIMSVVPSSGMLCHVALVRTDVLEKHSTSIIRVTIIGELGMLAVTSNRHTLQRNTSIHSISSQHVQVASYG
jgi:hypothetical protein